MIGSITIKTEDEKPKVKTEEDLTSSDTCNAKRIQSDWEGHCCKHCPHAKKRKRYRMTPETYDTLPDLEATETDTALTMPNLEPIKDTDTLLKELQTLARSEATDPTIEHHEATTTTTDITPATQMPENWSVVTIPNTLEGKGADTTDIEMKELTDTVPEHDDWSGVTMTD